MSRSLYFFNGMMARLHRCIYGLGHRPDPWSVPYCRGAWETDAGDTFDFVSISSD